MIESLLEDEVDPRRILGIDRRSKAAASPETRLVHPGESFRWMVSFEVVLGSISGIQ